MPARLKAPERPAEQVRSRAVSQKMRSPKTQNRANMPALAATKMAMSRTVAPAFCAASLGRQGGIFRQQHVYQRNDEILEGHQQVGGHSKVATWSSVPRPRATRTGGCPAPISATRREDPSAHICGGSRPVQPSSRGRRGEQSAQHAQPEGNQKKAGQRRDPEAGQGRPAPASSLADGQRSRVTATWSETPEGRLFPTSSSSTGAVRTSSARRRRTHRGKPRPRPRVQAKVASKIDDKTTAATAEKEAAAV